MANPSPLGEPILAAYAQFVQRIDTHAARVESAWGDELACRVGCSGCCHRDLTVFPLEAAVLANHIDGAGVELPSTARPTLTPTALAVLELEGAEPCVMLDAEGRCRVYAARPLICRTHGLPLAVQDDEGVYGDVCPLSFDGGAGLADLPSEDFLALETVNTVLVALNAQFVAATGADPARVSLKELARS
ncbi:MAG: YkgJ family cysteine cluster protein [Deltaproteobacteria bacterium]|nr:YkgJ family cysteine cluster protein [Deltaproteobacteria bacterium]